MTMNSQSPWNRNEEMIQNFLHEFRNGYFDWYYHNQQQQKAWQRIDNAFTKFEPLLETLAQAPTPAQQYLGLSSPHSNHFLPFMPIQIQPDEYIFRLSLDISIKRPTFFDNMSLLKSFLFIFKKGSNFIFKVLRK